MKEIMKTQIANKNEVLFEMPLGTWLLDLPEMADVKERCFGGDAQVTDFCEFGLKDPENKLPHKRPTALLATFQLRRAVRKCSGHHGLAHQWTKGYLSKRFGGVSRLGYSQRWTTMFCRDLLQDFADHCNPLKAPIGRAVTPPALGTHQSRSRSTYGLTKKVNDVFGATDKCVRCEAIRRGLSKQTRSRAHQRDKPDCRLHGEPIQKSGRGSGRVMRPAPVAPPVAPPAATLQNQKYHNKK